MKAKSVIGVSARISAITAATHFARPELHVTALEKNTRGAATASLRETEVGSRPLIEELFAQVHYDRLETV